MTSMAHSNRFLAVRALVALSVPLLAATPVFGQAAAVDSTGPAAGKPTGATTSGSVDDLMEIVVTGSSIRGIPAIGSSVIGITQEQVQNQGAASAADVLRDLPQVTNLGADPSRSAPGAAQRAVSNVAGGTSINLRGLGVEATLTLLDGYRVPQEGGDFRFFDPNSLPLIAVQRIEVVPGGASAIYGSDAVTGVVNIIPVTRYDGANVQVRQGWADGMRQSVDDAIAGHSWTGGGFVFAFEHSQQTSLAAGDRPGQYLNSPLGLQTRFRPICRIIRVRHLTILHRDPDNNLSARRILARSMRRTWALLPAERPAFRAIGSAPTPCRMRTATVTTCTRIKI